MRSLRNCTLCAIISLSTLAARTGERLDQGGPGTTGRPIAVDPDYLVVVAALPDSTVATDRAKSGVVLTSSGTVDSVLVAFHWSDISGSSDDCATLDAKARNVTENSQLSLSALGAEVRCATSQTNAFSDSVENLNLRLRASAAVVKLIQKYRDVGSARLITRGAPKIRLVTVHPAEVVYASGPTEPCPVIILSDKPTVNLDEQPRESQIVTDFGNLARIVAAFLTTPTGHGVSVHAPAAFVPCTDNAAKNGGIPVRLDHTIVPWLDTADVTFSLERATVALSVVTSKSPTTAVASVRDSVGTVAALKTVLDTSQKPKGDPAQAPTKQDQDLTVKGDLVTGPSEHWFLSADVPLNGTGAASLTVNSNTHSLDVANKPSSFMLAVNAMPWRDLSEDERDWWRGLYFKGEITASSNPLQGLGLGLGYRGKLLGVSLSTVTPFVGGTWTYADDSLAHGGIKRDARRSFAWRFGIGASLDKALNWVGQSSQPQSQAAGKDSSASTKPSSD